MDKYTEKTKVWLDERFKKCDEQGVYYAHQPIYGFKKGHSEPYLINRYIRTYQIMISLSHLMFDSLLDVGAAEGYKAYIAKQLFDVKVKCCDLSKEACKRAEEIFNLESTPADIHDLPFKNNEFDVVLCSETLEHVSDLPKAIDELLRVASKAVLITVPHDPIELIEKNIEERVPHAHIHNFHLDSMNYLMSDGFHIDSKRIISPLLRIPADLIDPTPREFTEISKHPKIVIDIYNTFIPVLRKVFGYRTASFMIQLDDFVCKYTSSYNAILFIIIKDNRCRRKKEIQNISAHQIITSVVPYHYLKRND